MYRLRNKMTQGGAELTHLMFFSEAGVLPVAFAELTGLTSKSSGHLT